MKARIAVAGAGIYGATIAIRLAEAGHEVHLFDPLGILRAASGINQYRVHAGYHYPRSPETILEAHEAQAEFVKAFAPAIVRNSLHLYAIPKALSLTAPAEFEAIMERHGLRLRPCRPEWMDFDFIEACYRVDEFIYDPEILRELIVRRICEMHVKFEQTTFLPEMRVEYDYVVIATYGLGPSRGIFRRAKVQVAEKILIQLPERLRRVALVVIDGPFTAFDPYGNSGLSLFGSAKNTNHWTTTDPEEPVPPEYASLLNRPAFEKVEFTRFHAMRDDAARCAPLVREAVYLGSRFTLRMVEDNPREDRRTLYIREIAPRELHIFSGKVVSAVKAARLICERVQSGA